MCATPIRANTPGVFLQRSREIFDSLKWTQRERAVLVNDYYAAPGQARYAGNARARNELIDRYLKGHHTHVLWLDVDLVSVPEDLIGRLFGLSISGEAGFDEIVAPSVYVERLDPSEPPSSDNGGWWYDAHGFLQDGKPIQRWDGVDFGGKAAVEVNSVGTCYLVPSWLYYCGHRYSAEGDEVEHVSFMKAARAADVRAFVARDIVVEHAYLPKYGDRWRR